MDSPSHRAKEQKAIRRWRGAEQRLYPALLAAPEVYDRYLALVRAVGDALGPVRSVEALVEQYHEGSGVAAGAARRHSIDTSGLDLDLAEEAGFCLRHRELVAESRRAEAELKIRRARDRGAEWVELQESSPWPEHPFPPWRSLRMRLADGVGIHSWVEEGLEKGYEYGVEVVRLDRDTGRWVDPQTSDRTTFGTPGPWREALDSLKARYDGTNPLTEPPYRADNVVSDTNVS